jgi:AcrR family transcriptional regulator
MPKSGENTRRAILDAANQIVLTRGVEHLTLDATAREAGISKGGLLYHFPSKEALIVGMIQYYLERFNRDFSAAAGQEPQASPGQWTRAYLETTFADNERNPRMSPGLLAAIAVDPSLLKPLQDTFVQWLKLVEDDGIDPVLANIARLVADGLWLVELFGLAPPSAEMKARVLARLEAMSRTPDPAKNTR